MAESEMLEMAAKAVGIVPFMKCGPNNEAVPSWDPLDDDGDALRLAVKLELKISHRTVDVDVSRGDVSASEYVPTYSGREEATRRAITRAAAKIGRSMK